jgi:hypothetical protein
MDRAITIRLLIVVADNVRLTLLSSESKSNLPKEDQYKEHEHDDTEAATSLIARPIERSSADPGESPKQRNNQNY